MNRGRDKFNKYKSLISLLAKAYSILPRKVRIILFEHYRTTKGLKGQLIRYVILKTIAKKLGNNVSIGPDVYILNVEELVIGDNVSIHPMCYINAKGGINIGNDVSIAHAVTLLSESHIYSDLNISIKDQGLLFKATEIKSNVWIGAKATILAGVTIGSGSIIAAGAVVTKSFNECSIVGGIPAKLIRTRK